MEIEFCLDWFEAHRPLSKAFKQISAYQLFSEYTKRISKWIPCQITGTSSEKRDKAAQLWFCDRGTGALILSSEELAKRFEQLLNSGVRKLQILIGGPNGFSDARIKELKPDLKWSFGSMTLAHELAAIVASEQIYRALTIIHQMPYHLGH
jgi:23S rRNA (pseudouridine1915-N3)-methyltransferase